MSRRKTFPTLGLLTAGAALLALAVPFARAETRDATTVALGWQTENAELVFVGTVADEPPVAPGTQTHGTHEVEFRVDRSIKGTAAVGSSVRVLYASHGVGLPWQPGVPHILFLAPGQPLPAAPGAPAVLAAYVPVSGAFSVRPLPPGSIEERFPDLVTSMQLALESEGPAALRTLLVTWMEDADAGVAWSAATDFVRHEEVHAGLADEERTRIVSAFSRQPIGKNTKGALALAAAATRTDIAVQALVGSLLADGAGEIRGPVTEALRRMDSPSAEGLLVARLKLAAPDRQAVLLGALGVVGGASGVPDVTPLLDATDGTVRVEAAAALGGMARNARAKDPSAQLGVAITLAAHLLDEGTAERPQMGENEARARMWALAQLDEPAAFDTLRQAAAATRPEVRDYAKRLLAKPRQSLTLR